MTENESTQDAESVETVAGTEASATQSTETPLLASKEGSSPDVLPWPPADVDEEMQQLVEMMVGKFLPADSLKSFLQFEMNRRGQNFTNPVEDIILSAAKHFDTNDLEWAKRLKYIFVSKYPAIEREVWSNGRICQKRYPKIRNESEYRPTFAVTGYSPIKDPKNSLGSKIAPSLYAIQEGDDGFAKVSPTAEAERFFNGERLAVPRSSLSEVINYNRPTWNVHDGWQSYKKGFLPKRIETARLTAQDFDLYLIEQFIFDLRRTFSWDNGNEMVKYLGMLIQPMVAHLSPGQNPAYAILGPTKSGKGYLSSVLPGIFYSRIGEQVVLVKKMPHSTYEMEVFLASCMNAIYLSIDETKNATEEELKMIDAMCTQEVLQARVMRQGYHEIPNLLTICLTAVHQTFTDETYGRLAVIKLQESRSTEVAEFHNRWKNRGPELLASLFANVANVEYNAADIERVPDRRPGFSVIAHFLEKILESRPDYAVDSSTNDVLDDICRMFEESNLGTKKGQWTRYTPANFVKFMSENYDRRWKRSSAADAINTALGYKSTVNHPNYKETGYPAESGRFYHFEVREEGIKTKRTFIYIREVKNENS